MAGQYTPTVVQCHTNIEHYNRGMGGTDGADQKCSYYKTTVVTKKWQHRLLTHFLILMAANAHVLWVADFELKRTSATFAFCGYLEALVRDCGDRPGVFLSEHDRANGRTPQKNQVSTFSKVGVHIPSIQHRQVGGKDHRRRCVLCGRKSAEMCTTCNVGCCISAENGAVSCWKLHHSN